MEKTALFQGQVRLWNGLVFGTLDSGDSVILGNSVADAKALVGCAIKYKQVSKEGEPTRFSVISIQL